MSRVEVHRPPSEARYARSFQRRAASMLGEHFSEVRLEWSVVADASDALSSDVRRYAPRVDIAVGPFNTRPGRDAAIDERLLPKFFRELFSDRPPNPNPRCLLAVEVVYSGSSKHVMGDTLNAGALGLYGLVVGADHVMRKINRIGLYLEVLAELEKLPSLFRNVIALSVSEFEKLVGPPAVVPGR